MANTGVEVSVASRQQLVTLIKGAYKQIAGEINGASNFGVSNRKVILGQIDKILVELGVNVNDFLKKEIPSYYKTGVVDARQQLVNVGAASIGVNAGFNRVHKEAIAALTSDTASSFADAIQGVKRNATRLLSSAVKQEIKQKIATGMIQGSTVRDVAKQIKGTLADEGITAIVDSRGRQWELDTYGEMLYRTKVVEARNLGMANGIAENGYDLAQVSIHHTLHQACAVWEGVIVSINGNTPGYPTLQDAEDAGLFHPNCEHAINVLTPTLSDQTQAYNSATGDYVGGGGLDLRNQSLDLEGF